MARKHIAQGRSPAARAVREYSSVEDFLTALTGNQSQTDVLLAPVYRPVYPGNGTTCIQAGTMLNGQPSGARRIYSCIALAAEAVLVGERGHLTYPLHGGGEDPQVRQRIHDLQRELLAVLSSYLSTDARVRRVRQPESLWVPTTKHWSTNALLGLPLAYQNGHWSATSGLPEPPL